MNQKTKSTVIQLLAALTLGITSIQGSLSLLPIYDPAHPMVMGIDANLKLWLTASLMFGVIIITNIKNYLSIEVRNGSSIVFIAIGVIAILGGLNHAIGLVPISSMNGAIIRFSITTLVGVLSTVSKKIWPTYESKIIEAQKNSLANDYSK